MFNVTWVALSLSTNRVMPRGRGARFAPGTGEARENAGGARENAGGGRQNAGGARETTPGGRLPLGQPHVPGDRGARENIGVDVGVSYLR
eukprot:17512-Prorocentrum_minimum.AAC.1